MNEQRQQEEEEEVVETQANRMMEYLNTKEHRDLFSEHQTDLLAFCDIV